MGFLVEVDERGGVTLTLSGWDRAMTMRRRVTVAPHQIDRAWATARGPLEQMIEHRVVGRGTHGGHVAPNRVRVGSMLARGEEGVHYWAVGSGTSNDPLLVVDLRDHDYSRLVVDVEGDPYAVAAAITELTRRS